MAKPRRKGRPFDPAAQQRIHDRKAHDLVRNAQVVAVEIDDPYEQGAKIVAFRSTRSDPLAWLRNRDQIDDAQYEAGRQFERDFEMAERGPKAIDFTREAVDGGLMPEPLTEEQRRAGLVLKRVYRALGADGSTIVHDVLVHKQTHRQIAAKRGLNGERWERYFGMRFSECLHTLAKTYGFATEGTGKTRIPSL